MSREIVVCEEKIACLRAYFIDRGLLLCNDDGNLPSNKTVGGDWNSIVALMERGEVFYSKLYKNKTTYLSREFYYQIKSYKQRIDSVSDNGRKVYEFVHAVDMASIKEIKQALMMSSREFNSALKELCKELLVTAARREKTLNDNGWCSFYWSTACSWEKLKPLPEVRMDSGRVYDLLFGMLEEVKILRLLR